MVSLAFVSCELVIQVLQLISCSQNMTLAFVKNALYSRVLAREFTCYFVTLKCEKNSFFQQKRLFMSFCQPLGQLFKKSTVSFFANFYL